MINEIGDIAHLAHIIFWPAFLCFLIWRTDIRGFREFCEALNQPGAHILIGYVLVITGVLMMKIMLYDDGKYIVGGGVGILAKALSGTGTNGENGKAPPNSSVAAATEVHIP
jgi:hypothetical protein